MKQGLYQSIMGSDGQIYRAVIYLEGAKISIPTSDDPNNPIKTSYTIVLEGNKKYLKKIDDNKKDD